MHLAKLRRMLPPRDASMYYGLAFRTIDWLGTIKPDVAFDDTLTGVLVALANFAAVRNASKH